MAFRHHITYKLDGTGDLLEKTIYAPKNTDAETILLSEVPNARIERILTEVTPR